MQLTIKTEHDLNFPCSTHGAFSAGEAAKKWAANMDSPQGPDWIFSQRHDKLMLAGIHASGIKPGASLHAGVALPYGWAEAKGPDLVKHLTRSWSIGEIPFDLSVKWEKQGVMTLVNHAFDGKKLDYSYFDNSLVIDPGGFSTEAIRILDRGARNKSDSFEVGIKRIADRLIVKMKPQVKITRQIAMQAVIDKTIYCDEWIDLSAWIDGELQELANDVISAAQIVTGQESWRLIPFKLLSGGPAPLIAPYMPPGITISEQPLFGNALGALWKAKFTAQKGQIPVGIDIGFDSTKIATFQKGGFILGVVFPSLTGEFISDTEGLA